MPDESRPPLRLADPPPPGWPGWFEGWVLPYLRDPALVPVAIALLGHVVVILAPLMLAVWRHGSLLAGAVLGVLLAISLGLAAFEVRRSGWPRAVSLALASTWAVSAGLAWLCERTGVL